MLSIKTLFEQEEQNNEEKDDPNKVLPVCVVKRIQIENDWICPHCGEVIGEKATFFDQESNTWSHRSCGGKIELPPSGSEEDPLNGATEIPDEDNTEMSQSNFKNDYF